MTAIEQKEEIKTVVRFPGGLPGLGRATEWELVESEDVKPFLWLRCCNQPALSLIVIDPRNVVESYEPRIGRADLNQIEESDLSQCVMLTIVTIEGETASVNLRAPLLINPRQMLGHQVILDDSKWAVRHTLSDAQEQQETTSGEGGAS